MFQPLIFQGVITGFIPLQHPSGWLCFREFSIFFPQAHWGPPFPCLPDPYHSLILLEGFCIGSQCGWLGVSKVPIERRDLVPHGCPARWKLVNFRLVGSWMKISTILIQSKIHPHFQPDMDSNRFNSVDFKRTTSINKKNTCVFNGCMLVFHELSQRAKKGFWWNFCWIKVHLKRIKGSRLPIGFNDRNPQWLEPKKHH